MMLNSNMAPLEHGGDLGAVRALFPGAPRPFIDLSTGINPYPYPVPRLSLDAFTRLPEQAAVKRLSAIAAAAYGAPSSSHIVPAPGTQILLPQVAALVRAGRAAILGPTYAEHARAVALARHAAVDVHDLEELCEADIAIVVNPNNPDGRIVTKERLLTLADKLRMHGGLLVVDEAFMDVGPCETSLAGDVRSGNIVVLRSFGKFFGLAGVRLGFALGAPDLVARLAVALGPWAVSGPALAIGEIALADAAWAEQARARLTGAASELDRLLVHAGLEVIGGTSLFRLAQADSAAEIFHRLASAGILVRKFGNQPTWLRFGIPDDNGWERLRSAIEPPAG